jgi:glycosyltransferase involved in cell wall biosynthesis
MMSYVPKVTVLMPIYNGEKYLRDAIESILSQTFKDFEFLIINDGSTDSSVKIIESYDDPRIRLVNNESNLKLVLTLNKGLLLSRGEYIARMDCDDISYPKRLELQVKFMDSQTKVGISGTWVETIGDQTGIIFRYPTDSKKIQSRLLFDSPLAHPSVIFRKTFVERFKLKYEVEDLYAEDWSMWQKCSFIFPISNIPIVLLKYRITEQSMSRSNADKQLNVIKKIHGKNIQALCGEAIDTDIEIHTKLGMWQFTSDRSFIENSERWLIKLKHSNKLRKTYPESEFIYILAERWFFVCNSATGLGLVTWSMYWNSSLRKYSEIYKHVYLFAKCLIKWPSSKKHNKYIYLFAKHFIK